uniref:Uncharacterized protein n=1 Tax=Arundo donax TaxID=35708 RepID=A0A0A9AMD2_ARUDO
MKTDRIRICLADILTTLALAYCKGALSCHCVYQDAAK